MERDRNASVSQSYVIRPTQWADAEQLERLQEIVFPTLSDHQRFKAQHYRKHIELFPAGQFVAVAGDRVIGMTTSIRLNFDFAHGHHTFDEVFQNGWLTAHHPEGQWLYGADIGTHPEFRGLGIARELYRARQQSVQQLGLLGQVTVGMLYGFSEVCRDMGIDAYYEELALGRRSDPTISAQCKIGFQMRGLVRDYLEDPACANSGVLLVLDAKQEVAGRGL
jgi:GNAT superfamily N-acetyltransferase